MKQLYLYALVFVILANTGCQQSVNQEVFSDQDQHTMAVSEHANVDEHIMETLPVEKRVAFMSGHVQAGIDLYKAGAPDQAAKHLLHPVSETHEAERVGIDALGFDQSIFVAVSKALEEGLPAHVIEPQLAAAQANMILMQQNAGGNPVEIIEFLMDVIVEEYAIGVTDMVITDPGEYQDAYGFAVVARGIAERMDHVAQAELVEALNDLLALWPDNGPLEDSYPTSVETMNAAVMKVRNIF